MAKIFTLACTCFILTCSASSIGSPNDQSVEKKLFPFTDVNWQVYGGKTAEIDGKACFMGTAILKEVEFSEGTLEWDMYATGDRSYCGIIFHVQESGDLEELYIRPHKANGILPDAIQYTPAFHNVSCWQLYHGEGFTSPIKLSNQTWIHYKMVLKGKQAKLFIGVDEYPAFEIHTLILDAESGQLGVKGPVDGSAYFANFTVTKDVDVHFDKVAEQPSAAGVVKGWMVSQPITNNLVNQSTYPGAKALEQMQWKPVSPDANGMVNLTRELIRNPTQPGWTYAKTNIQADQGETRRFSLGYSDFVTVFLNGQPLFSGTNSYTSRDPAFAGLIGFFDEVYLPLKKGGNELVLLVGEQFGGWGFMFQDPQITDIDPMLEKRWELAQTLSYPESVAWDSKRSVLYVSNFLAGQQEFISMIDLDGSVQELKWLEGLRKPSGMVLTGDSLYVVERTGVAVIDIPGKKISRRIPLQGAIFPNDIALSPDKKFLLISDGPTNRIYKIQGQDVTVWMESPQIPLPNGLAIGDGKVYAGCSGESALKCIDMNTQEVTTLVRLFPGAIMDGLQIMGKDHVLFSDFNGHLYEWEKGKDYRQVLNTSGVTDNLADFLYIPEKNQLIVPTLYTNKILAFKLK